MPTWTELQEYTRNKYTLEDDKPSMLSMTWTYEDGRKQKLVVRKYQAFGRDMVEFKSPFARVGEVDPQVLLQKNAELPLAAIAQSGDVYLAVYNAFLDNLRLEDFDLILVRVAAVADKLEETFVHGDSF